MTAAETTPAGVRLRGPYDSLQAPRFGLEVRPYLAGDETKFEARGDFLAERGDAPLPTGLRWTLTRDGEPRAVGGVSMLSQGFQSLWGFTADLRPREWWLAYRYLRMVGDLMHRRGWILLALAADGRPARMLEAAGFRWTSGQTYIWRG